MKKYVILKTSEITNSMLDETAFEGGRSTPVPIFYSGTEDQTAYSFISFPEIVYPDSLKYYRKFSFDAFQAEKAIVEGGGTPVYLEEPIRVTQNRPSVYEVSLRIEGDNWTCPANQVTQHFIPLNDDYEIRGAEFQFVNGKAGDVVEVWVTDKDGVAYPAGTQLTKYVNKFCVYDHEPGTQAWVADLVDDDTSDLVPSFLYLEFKYTNNQASGPDVKAIVNFWMYKRT